MSVAFVQTIQAREVQYGANRYVEYYKGDVGCPLILSAPHGGFLRPSSIPDRTGNVTTVQDSYTIETSKGIDEAFFEQAGCRPHLILSLLHRIKMDPNRPVEEAVQHPEAEVAYYEFHGFIEEAKRAVEASSNTGGRGLYIDVHGHGHPEMWIEWGYLLTAFELKYRGDRFNELVDETSIRNLVGVVENETLETLIRGDRSFSARMERMDSSLYKSVPGPTYLDPNFGSYFSGGYNTQIHGSRDGRNIDGIQIELPQDIRFTSGPRNRFCVDFATVAVDFLTDFYGYRVPSSKNSTSKL